MIEAKAGTPEASAWRERCRKTRPVAERVGAYLVVAVFLLFVVFPIYWIVITSVKLPRDILSDLPVFLPRQVTWEHYVNIFRFQLFPAFWNSLIASSVSTALAVTLGTLAAYGFCRFEFRGKRDLLFWVLSTRMMPPVVVVIPLFVLMSHVGLIDTVYSLIIVYTAMNLPFAVWLMATFVSGIPTEMEEAAELDGCSVFQRFRHVTVPLVSPGIVTAATFCFIFAWNEFLFALIFARRVAVTLPIALGSLHATFGPEWGRISALTLVVALPIWILALVTQKYIVRGLTMGAIK